MATSKTWNSYEDWLLWVNESDPLGDQTNLRRLVGDYLKLPYVELSISNTNPIARWRFGQNQDTSDSSGNGNTATLQSGAEISELGLNMPSKNAHATVAEISNFDLAAPLILAMWCKSRITDYSSDPRHILAGFTTGVADGEIQYAVGIVDNDPDVNVDNEIVGFFDESGTTKIAIPITTVTRKPIDTDWHVLILLITAGASAIFIDNDYEGDGGLTFATYSSISGSPQFSIGASQFDTSTGFFGIIDEVTLLEFVGDGPSSYPTWYRFSPQVYLSPVFDTERNYSVMSSILTEYDSPNGSAVTFAFRASDTEFSQDDTTLKWTGFTSSDQIPSLSEIDLMDIGVFTQGRYHQVKMELRSSTQDSPIPDPLRTETPVMKSLTVKTSPPDIIIHPTQPAYQPGIVLGQIAGFSGEKRIDKVTLNLSTTINDRRDFHVGSSRRVSFAAVNFQSSRDAWVFQPVPHWSDEHGWDSSGLTLSNSLQTLSYTDLDDAITNAPYLSYDFYIPTGGVWSMWGFGWAPDGIWWSIDDDTTNLRKMTLGQNISGFTNTPYWTKFGSMFFEEGGLHKFTVYLSSSTDVYLDEWLFTVNQQFETVITERGIDGFVTPMPTSKGPFNTVVRLRSLENGEPVPLVDPPNGSNIISAYKSSIMINGSGKYNYAIQNSESGTGAVFNDGVFIEYMHIGGNADFFASWDYNFV